jgi:hypothetical protein
MSIIPSRNALHPLALPFLEKCDYKKNLFSVEVFAINEYVKKLVGFNLWDKLVGLWPFVGRRADLHSINLKTPGTYDIWWGGSSLTHNEMGVHGNGAGWGNTLIALRQFKSHDIHISVYNATSWYNANSVDYFIGANDKHAGNNLVFRDTSQNYTYNLGDNRYYYWRPVLGVHCGGPGFHGQYDESIIYAQIPWEEWRNYYGLWSCTNNYGTKFEDGYFAGEPSFDEQSVQLFGHIVGSKSRMCFVQGESFGHVAPATIPRLSGFLLQDEDFNNGGTAPFVLFRGPLKFGKPDSMSRANLRMASVGYGLNEFEAKLFFEATQEFQAILSRSVDRLYLDPEPKSHSEKSLISVSFSNLIDGNGFFPDEISNGNDIASFSLSLSIIINGPIFTPFEDEPIKSSIEIIYFLEE